MTEMPKKTTFDREVLERYFTFLETMTAANLSALREHCHADVHFRDPFNNVRGVDRYIRIMEETFENLKDVRFEIIEKAYYDDGAFLKWHFHFRLGKEPEKIVGVTQGKAKEGRIIAHLDYWDAGERIYAKVPVVGGLIRFMRRKLSINEDNVAA